MKIYIIIFLLAIIIILWFQKRSENFTNDEAVQSISKMYADSSGTLIVNNIKSMNNITSNQIKVGNIDVSGNMDISGNIKLKGNIDISGTITGILNQKAYYTGSYNGKLKVETIPVLKAGQIKILKNEYWSSFKNEYEKSDSKKTIVFDNINGIYSGFDKNKLYKIEAYIHIGVFDGQNLGDTFVARWFGKNESSSTEVQLTRSSDTIYDNRANVNLSPITIVSGYDNYILTLQKSGGWTQNLTYDTMSITIVITEF